MLFGLHARNGLFARERYARNGLFSKERSARNGLLVKERSARTDKELPEDYMLFLAGNDLI